MHYPEEGHAKDLLAGLSGGLASAASDAVVSVSGAGVHWDCTAARGGRSCVIHCFHLKRPDGPQYSAAFRHGPDTVSVGRTRSSADVVAATAAWLEGHALDELHRRHDFLDRVERSLTALATDVVARRPALGRLATHAVRPRVSEFAELLFTAGDRMCEVSYHGEDRTPISYFLWDGFLLFELHPPDAALLAPVLERWLCDRAMPSAIAAEFPSVELRTTARYHEEGRPLEGEFLASWDRIEGFYRQFTNWPAVERQVLPFIRQIRSAGFDRLLRAGQSMTTLVVSRSKHHGLRNGQPRVAFEFGPAGMDVYADFAREDVFRSRPVELTREIHTLLQRLASAKID